jgi:hypothetical protein
MLNPICESSGTRYYRGSTDMKLGVSNFTITDLRTLAQRRHNLSLGRCIPISALCIYSKIDTIFTLLYLRANITCLIFLFKLEIM